MFCGNNKNNILKGFYQNTPQNQKLGRVGQEYDVKIEKVNVVTAEDMYSYPETKIILEGLFGDDEEGKRDIEYFKDYLAKTKNYKENIYYRVEEGIGRGISGMGNGLYLGKDKEALKKFYGNSEGSNYGKRVEVSTFVGTPKWLDLIEYSKYNKFLKDIKIENLFNSNKVGEVVKKMGFDGIRYYDPTATGEEFVLFNINKVKKNIEIRNGKEYKEPNAIKIGDFVIFKISGERYSGTISSYLNNEKIGLNGDTLFIKKEDIIEINGITLQNKILGNFKKENFVEKINKLKDKKSDNIYINQLLKVADYKTQKLFNNTEYNGFSFYKDYIEYDKLISLQDTVSAEKIIYLNSNPKGSQPQILKYKDKYYIWDGNHRIITNILNGKKEGEVLISEIDEI